eukprot:365068-Chlamydomonas_euryale.AAC.1
MSSCSEAIDGQMLQLIRTNVPTEENLRRSRVARYVRTWGLWRTVRTNTQHGAYSTYCMRRRSAAVAAGVVAAAAAVIDINTNLEDI